MESVAQIKSMKQIARKSNLELAQFIELQPFAWLDKTCQNQLARSWQLWKLLKQSQSSSLQVLEQMATIYTRIKGYPDLLEIKYVEKFFDELGVYSVGSELKKIKSLAS